MSQYGPEEFKLKNGEVIVFRHCSPQDAELFPVFQQKIAIESTNTLQIKGKTPPLDKVKANWLMCEAKGRLLRLGVFTKRKDQKDKGEELVGQLGFDPLGSDHPWVNHIGRFGMMIVKDYWGLGVGKRLLQIMEEHARQNNFTRIEAMVRTENERGVHLYIGAGYLVEGVRRQAVLIDGRYQDEYYLGKLL